MSNIQSILEKVIASAMLANGALLLTAITFSKID
jgi:hypothetical protein